MEPNDQKPTGTTTTGVKAREQALADTELLTRYRFACRQAEDLLGTAPADVHRRVVAALTNAATKAKRRDLDMDVARQIAAAVVRGELQGAS